METEEKFQNGMLGKMAKVTDLMARMDELTAGADGERAKKWLP